MNKAKIEWGHVNSLCTEDLICDSLLPSTTTTSHPAKKSLSIAARDASDWFQWQVGVLTGSRVTKDTTPIEIRKKICEVEQKMVSAVKDGEMIDENLGYIVNHFFSEGVYRREMHIPAGHIIVGKLHKHELVNIITKGRVTVITEQCGVEEFVAPIVFTSPAGTKRLLFTHEDTVWSGIHPTYETDLAKIEDEFIAKTYTEIGLEQPNLIEHGFEKL